MDEKFKDTLLRGTQAVKLLYRAGLNAMRMFKYIWQAGAWSGVSRRHAVEPRKNGATHRKSRA